MAVLRAPASGLWKYVDLSVGVLIVGMALLGDTGPSVCYASRLSDTHPGLRAACSEFRVERARGSGKEPSCSDDGRRSHSGKSCPTIDGRPPPVPTEILADRDCVPLHIAVPAGGVSQFASICTESCGSIPSQASVSLEVFFN